MSGPLGSHELMYATGSDFYEYKITNSLRLNGTDQALEKTFSGAASNDDAKAISVWIKRTGAEGTNSAFGSTTNTKIVSASTGNGATGMSLEINTNNPTGYSDQFHYYNANGGGNYLKAKWRDPSAWIHIVWIYNSDESTAIDRVKVYINGDQKTINDSNDWDNDGNNGYPASGTDTTLGKQSCETHIGRYVYDDGGWWGGQMADFICIDGTAAITDFGETKNGVWVPKDPSGLTFGNNGFWLKFTNSSAMGEDYSGNDNDFAHIGTISTHDQLIDSPTNNFPAINPLNLFSISESNLAEANLHGEGGSSGSASGGNWRNAYCTFKVPLSGSYYWEFVSSNHVYAFPAIQTMAARANTNSHNTDFSIVQAGEYRIDGSGDANTSNISTGDIIGIWVNDSQVKVYVNNSLDHTFSSNLVAGKDYFPTIVGSSLGYFNFGQDSSFAGQKTAQGNADSNGIGDFYYSPKGLALCSQNLSVAEAIDPAETDDNFPQKLFKAVPYTGNDGGTSNNITFGFKPDMAIINMRGNTGGGYPAQIWDTTRGDDYYMYPSGTAASVTSGTDYLEFTSTGLKTDESWDGINHNGETYIAHGWRANGGTTSTNSSGDINTTVQVDPSGCFSIATWTGSGNSGETIGHGLSAAPSLTVIKQTGGGTNGWNIWASGNNSGDVDSFGEWNGTSAWNQNQGSNGPFTAAPTSTLLTLTAYGQVNASSKPYIGYFFADCEGYIKSGSYEGNGNAEGTFVYTGFSPAYIWCKSVDSTSDWLVFDNERLGFNVDNNATTLNGTAAETTTDMIDILSNGFKCRIATDPNVAETYVYLAMAHNPFKYATAR